MNWWALATHAETATFVRQLAIDLQLVIAQDWLALEALYAQEGTK